MVKQICINSSSLLHSLHNCCPSQYTIITSFMASPRVCVCAVAPTVNRSPYHTHLLYRDVVGAARRYEPRRREGGAPAPGGIQEAPVPERSQGALAPGGSKGAPPPREGNTIGRWRRLEWRHGEWRGESSSDVGICLEKWIIWILVVFFHHHIGFKQSTFINAVVFVVKGLIFLAGIKYISDPACFSDCLMDPIGASKGIAHWVQGWVSRIYYQKKPLCNLSLYHFSEAWSIQSIYKISVILTDDVV